MSAYRKNLKNGRRIQSDETKKVQKASRKKGTLNEEFHLGNRIFERHSQY